MGRLTDILDAGTGAQPTTVERLLATLEAEENPEPHLPVQAGDGTCPNSQQCELERQQRAYYLPRICHWRMFGDVGRCPKNGGVK